MKTLPSRRGAMTAGVAAALSLALAACGGGSGVSGGDATGPAAVPSKSAAVQDALSKPAELTFWTWVTGIEKTVARFEAKYPNIKVNVVNAGQSADQYTKLQTAIKAGSGAPDVAQIEYFALPQFALSKQVVNLSEYGADALKDKFAASAWNQVVINGGVYGIPQDTGPMAMFYRKDIFDRLKLEPPKTWAEFAEAAKKIKADNPDNFITSIDPGDAGGVDSLIWQAGGQPFKTSGESNVSVTLDSDPGVKQWVTNFGTLLKDKLVEPQPGWTDEWWKGMGSGKYATWLTGAWAPGAIMNSIPKTKGKWAVAPMPQYDAATPMNAENGGSSVAVIPQSKNIPAAVAFAEWLNSDPEAVKSLNEEAGLFPATKVLLDDPAFRDVPWEFFGGQKINQVLGDASAAVRPGWQYLPFQVYANSIFKDTVGQAIDGGGDLTAALKSWQDRITAFGAEQGFTLSNS
ncbi:multiple sugar transport system substrate-binding protein [Thermocatellispora tengchongensis]|uniref:Multiple sugar transport system substrate-binding protein n=1 Tax=Thermocatellispora tengchongensis TaxID=1073253 RepID=A0A840PG31_9ACTN|nr:sugar ABC transporter substrate-binding protein [Thermocatellispora tengchongensis]MBB5134995.1 multiple sugar transport system substrate-binding protein [Thermocatellispora tengchongensis]